MSVAKDNARTKLEDIDEDDSASRQRMLAGELKLRVPSE